MSTIWAALISGISGIIAALISAQVPPIVRRDSTKPPGPPGPVPVASPSKSKSKILGVISDPIFRAVIGAIIGVILGYFIVVPLLIRPPIPPPPPTPFPTTSTVGIPLQLISQPNYANVGGTLVSDSLSGQNIELSLSFVNNGKDACTGVKFHTLDLINSSGPLLKPTSSIDQSWTLPPGVPQSESVQFQIQLGSESQYTLTLYLDVGGCATPHDNSPNRYANYKVEFSVTE